jgi:hypothetical protein
MRISSILFLCVALLLRVPASSAQTTIRQAVLDSTQGQLRIVLSNNHVIEPAKDSDQVGFAQVAVSSDHRIVGWVSLYKNCCTSYPIPLELVLLSASGRRTVIQNTLPIWEWSFEPGGHNVVIRQAPVHGDAPERYERHDISTGRLLASATSDSNPLPSWTRLRVHEAQSPPAQSLPRSTTVELPATLLRTYVGLYELTPGEELDVSLHNAALYIRSTSGGEAVRLWPESRTSFFVKDAEARVRFIRDAKGKVTGLLLHQFGRDRAARKL